VVQDLGSTSAGASVPPTVVGETGTGPLGVIRTAVSTILARTRLRHGDSRMEAAAPWELASFLIEDDADFLRGSA
jgi:hypothetical protein